MITSDQRAVLDELLDNYIEAIIDYEDAYGRAEDTYLHDLVAKRELAEKKFRDYLDGLTVGKSKEL